MQKTDLVKIVNKMILFEEVTMINRLKGLIEGLDKTNYSEGTRKELCFRLDTLLVQSTNHAKWLNELQQKIMELL
jgi:hypothetical protein